MDLQSRLGPLLLSRRAWALSRCANLHPASQNASQKSSGRECSEDRNSTEMLIFPSLLSDFALRYCKHLKNKSTAGGSPLRHWQPGPCSSREHPDATGLPCSSESVGRLPMLSPCSKITSTLGELGSLAGY